MSTARQIDARRAFGEAVGLLRGPQRAVPLIGKLVSDTAKLTFEQKHLYSYTTTKRSSEEVLNALLSWILNAQRKDGGIAAYYSLLTGYSNSYPEVTGYIVPTLYDLSRFSRSEHVVITAENATNWLLSLQMANGAFPAGLYRRASADELQPSVFNTGQILQGLTRSYVETGRADILKAAIAACDWLTVNQQSDGSWSGEGTYQKVAHSYYSMVAWGLAELSQRTANRHYATAAERNLDWVLPQFRTSGWVDGINLRGHPNFLHFIAYVLQGVLECGVRLGRVDATEAAATSAWTLLRKFETGKYLAGAFEADFKNGSRFTCLTGNAQISWVWLRLYEIMGDLRYLNAALKMNEMLKQLVPLHGNSGVAGGVAGSYPIWGPYQPLRYISWGCKFLADALLLEQRLTRLYEASTPATLSCAS